MRARSSSMISLRVFMMAIAAVTLTACAPEKVVTTAGSCSNRISPAYAGPNESSICTTTTNYTSSVNITVQGRYQKRALSGAGLGAAGAARPIRHAEVRILSGTGSTLQCGALNGSGNVTLAVPPSTSNYSIQIFSRADNSVVKASVLDCPEENKPHSITQSFLADSAKTVTVTAGVTGEVPGGAFNILDQIVDANDFLRTQVGTCAFTGCAAFTVAPKVSAYWEKGFNPNVYQGEANSGISFYLPGYRRLFIMGGVGGEVDDVDTDHFDDPVILHEYGHFLEDVYSITDSPGGSHSGNATIDPRLAWSEGWANFIQAAIRGDARYMDSFGNIDGATGLLLGIPIDSPGGSCTIGSATPGCDLPEFASEGNFREFAITRYLWDIFDSVNAFDEVWASITSTEGFNNTLQAFRNIGLLNEIQATEFTGVTTLTSLKTATDHLMGDTTEYSKFVAPGTCGAFAMDPVWNQVDDSGSFSTSFLVPNNDFYFIKHAGGTFNLTLTYNTPNTGGGEERESDLDLYVYNESGRYGNSADIVAASQDYFDNNQNTPETESVSRVLPAGNYLINVRVFTGTYDPAGCIGNVGVQVCQNARVPAGDPLTYTLTYNTGTLCPAARP